MNYFIAILCVLGIAAGQILFKLCATSLQRTGSYLALETGLTLFAALGLYGVTTLAWIWVLMKLDLGKVYPFMALAFIIVPVASHFVFGEQFKTQYFLGVTLIMLGIVIAVRA